jgi:hypothetical protein
MTDTPKLKGSGGPGRGQGRKPGSFRLKNRLARAERFYELKWKFAMEGVPKPVEAAENAMYDEDHPEGDISGDDEKGRYRDALKKLRLRGRSESLYLNELDSDLATEQDPERREQLIKQLDQLGLSRRRRPRKR